jgi:hypothetical protein
MQPLAQIVGVAPQTNRSLRSDRLPSSRTQAGNGETMEPFLAGAAGKALATIAASLGPAWASKLLLRWRVSRRASKRLKASGIEVTSRSLRLWLARPDVQGQLIRGEQANIGTVQDQLALVMVGTADHRASAASTALGVVLEEYLRLCRNDEARVLMTRWQIESTRTDGQLTRDVIGQTRDAVLARLDTSNYFDAALETLDPYSAKQARDFAKTWPRMESLVVEIAQCGDRAALMRQWAETEPGILEQAPPGVLCWLGILAASYDPSAGASFVELALARGAFPADYWRARRHMMIESDEKLSSPAPEAHPLYRLVFFAERLDFAQALQITDEWAPDDELNQIIRATIRARILAVTGRIPEAIATLRAQMAATESAAMMLLCAEYLLMDATARNTPIHIKQQLEALQLSVRARDFRRRWHGDSAEATVLAVKAAAVAGNTREAWALTQVPTEGHASPTEAADLRIVAESGRIAVITGRRKHAEQVAEQLPKGFPKSRILAMMADQDSNSDQAAGYWRECWELATKDEEYVEAANGLAELGVDLPDLVDLSTRQPRSVEAIRNIHSVMSQTDSLEQALLAHKNENLGFAMRLAEIYTADLEYAKAAEVLESAGQRWSHPEVLAMAADRFRMAGQLESSVKLAHSALTIGGEDWEGAAGLRGFLVETLYELGQTDAATDMARSLVSADGSNRSARWLLTHCLVSRGEVEQAWVSLLVDAEPIEPRSQQDARVWVSLGARFSKNPDFIARSLKIIETWPDDPQFSTRALMAVMEYMRRPDVTIDSDDQARFQEAFSANVEKFADRDSGITAIDIGDMEEGFGEFGRVLREQYEQRKQLQEATEGLVIPIGFHAHFLNITYGEALVRKVDRVTVCYNPMAPSDSVAAAMGTTVAADLSALYTLALVDGKEREALIGAFLDLVITDPAFHDVLQAQMNLAPDQGSTITWDPVAQIPRIIDRPDEMKLAKARLDAMLGMARNISRRPWPELKVVSSEFGITDGWIRTFDFAVVNKMQFWCDDFYLRELARSYEVQAFSTEDVLRQLELTHRMTGTSAQVIRLALARASYVDLEYGSETLGLAMAADSYEPLGVADILSHQSSWADPDSTMALLLHAVAQLDRTKFESYATWVGSAAAGLAKASSDSRVRRDNLSVLLENMLTTDWMDAEHVPFALSAVRSATSSDEEDPWRLTLERVHAKLRKKYPPAAAKSILMASIRLCSEKDGQVAARVVLTSEL